MQMFAFVLYYNDEFSLVIHKPFREIEELFEFNRVLSIQIGLMSNCKFISPDRYNSLGLLTEMKARFLELETLLSEDVDIYFYV